MSDHEHNAPKAPQSGAETADGASPAALDAGLQGHLGRYLRHLYDDVVQQPVPDRFVKLLEELERKSAERE